MAGRLDVIPLAELYEKPKMTPAVIKNIMLKEDFSEIQPNYCDKVCALPCSAKNPGGVRFKTQRCDILIVLPYPSMDEKWKKGFVVDRVNEGIINQLAKEKLKGLTFQITYAMKCQPAGMDKVTIAQARRCTPYLSTEIKKTKPRIVLGLGVDVGKILGLPKVPRGIPRTVKLLDTEFDLICSLHPKILTMIRQNASGEFWGPDYLDVLRYDFDKVARVARGEVTLRQLSEVVEEIKKTRIIVPTTLQEIIDFRDYLFSQTDKGPVVVSWDTETTSLDPWYHDARLLCCQFGYRDIDGVCKSFVVPLWHRQNITNNFFSIPEAWDIVRSILESELITKVTHNGMFDLLYTRVTTGVEVKNVAFDTMLLLHSLNSGMQGYYDLKTAISDHLFELQLAEYENGLVWSDEDESEEANIDTPEGG